QEAGHAQIGGRLERVDRGIGGEDEDLQLRPHASQTLDDVEAILVAQPEVADGEVGVERLGHGAVAVSGIADLMTLLVEKRLQSLADRHLVVDQQNLLCHTVLPERPYQWESGARAGFRTPPTGA